MTTQHTHGPWITGDASIWALDDCEFHAIVDCPLNQTCRDTETAWANARLIAASPDLLEALIMALPYVETALEDQGYKPGAVDRMCSNIRAAIAKATGETT